MAPPGGGDAAVARSGRRPLFATMFATFFVLVGLLLVLTKHMALNRHLAFTEVRGPVSTARDRFFHLAESRAKSRSHAANTALASSSTNSTRHHSRCRLTFPPSCPISPNLIPYWEEATDCYESPLRRGSGLSAPVQDRRYVVFQPDLGGWNNIRMALEVVILFAVATGRILVMPPHAVLYLLAGNKKWGDNKSTMDDYLDFRWVPWLEGAWRAS